MFAGGSLESGNTWESERDIGFDSARNDFSVFFGVNSWLGPLYLGAGYDDRLLFWSLRNSHLLRERISIVDLADLLTDARHLLVNERPG